ASEVGEASSGRATTISLRFEPTRQCSSAVEQPIRNRQVVGSNPTIGSKRTPALDESPGGACYRLRSDLGTTRQPAARHDQPATVHWVVTVPEATDPRSRDLVRSRRERGLREPVNGITHMVGVGLALVVTVLLPLLTSGGGLAIFALLVFGLSSLVLFSASSLLHSIRAEPRTETWLRRFDHGAIFILIAGSYTPVLL